MNSTCMIEVKKEYTVLLCHILSPLILEGLQSIYNLSKTNSQKNNVLKAFQLCLKAIPDWDIERKEKETKRILTRAKDQPWLINLIQTIFKLTILINTINIKSENISELNIASFIHAVYIECARQFWIDPYLFYHECSSLEQKRNYSEILKIICCCIENAIRRVLPFNLIFNDILGSENVKINLNELDIGKMYDVRLILENTPLDKKQVGGSIDEKANLVGGNDIQMGPTNESQQQINQQMIAVQPQIQPQMVAVQPQLIGGQGGQIVAIQPQMGNQMTNDINEKILNIINKTNVLSESNEHNNNNFTVNNHSVNNNQMIGGNELPQNKHHSDRKSSSTLKRIIHESIKQSHHSATKSNSNNSELKNKILKDLDSDTGNYNPEDNAHNYQDIFSNSDVKHTINTHEKAEKKSREKFFNNYLNI